MPTSAPAGTVGAMRRPLRSAAAALLTTALVLGVPAARSSADASAVCPSAGSASLLLTDLLTCLGADLPAAGPAATTFRQQPGVDYRGLYSAVPAPLPLPAGCDAPVRGTWTQDPGVVTRVTEREGRPVFEVTTDFHWVTGFGAGSRSVSMGDFWVDPSGLLVYVSRELLEGNLGGQPGSATVYNIAHIDPSGSYVGRGYVVGASEGLAGLRLDALYTGRLGQGGRWQSGRWCLVGQPRTTASAAARSAG